MAQGTCTIGDCTTKLHCRGMCSKHYRRWRLYGDPGVVLVIMDESARFEASYKVDKVTGCWLWTETINSNGYPAFQASGRQQRAYRWAWEQKYGPVPDGLQLDHFACNTPICVNPDHVRLVTARENGLRGTNVAATNLAKRRCHRGHLFDKANTYVFPDGRRSCRTCARIHQRTYLAKRRQRRQEV